MVLIGDATTVGGSYSQAVNEKGSYLHIASHIDVHCLNLNGFILTVVCRNKPRSRLRVGS
jgi:hypothetical protein